MKDFPAMGNPDYYISTALTGDSGRDFMATLTSAQAEFVYTSMKEQRPLLQQIVEIRKTVALELRKAITGQTPDKNLVYSSVKKYGELDAEISLSMAKAFAQIYKTLTAEQKKQLVSIRNQSVLPKGVYLYSDTTD